MASIASSPAVTPATRALVLTGGGARTAYQVGALRAIASILETHPQGSAKFPFSVLVGTSAGALNTAFLASRALQGLQAFGELSAFWTTLRSHHVYQLNTSSVFGKYLSALRLARNAMRIGAIFNSLPLVDTLHRTIALTGIEAALQQRAIDSLAITASSYTTGLHWTFCQCHPDAYYEPWARPGRHSERQAITIEHLAASSAIPFIFPPTPLWVDGHVEYFGDGATRQISPLSPALQLGASKIVVIGAGQPHQNPSHGTDAALPPRPNLGAIAGYAMASVFHNTLMADVEHAERINRSLARLPPALASMLPYRPISILAIEPSASLDQLALRYLHELPHATHYSVGGKRTLHGGGAALASYLLFEPGFIQALMQLGEQDVYARKDEVIAFFA